MCGLVVALSKINIPPGPDLLGKMNQRISHRGPDQHSVWAGKKTALAFSRLAIHDLSPAGSQPMLNHAGTHLIVFNGEIYNFKELHAELLAKGHVFRSKTDTEVILNSYLEWGEECVGKFMGMFAFAIVELSTEKVILARDHLGIKPLFKFETRDCLYFSSEIKAFSEITQLEPDPTTFYEQFHFRYVAGKKTPFKGVERVAPGTYEIYDSGRLIKRKRFFSPAESFKRRGSWSMEELTAKLEGSIDLHTRSDVGYNLQLSGGLDSSYVTAVLAKDTAGLRTYSIALQDKRLDESAYQDLIASEFKTHHHKLMMTDGEFADSLFKATYHMDIPVIHYGCVMLMNLCFAAAETSKVILTGEGADEIFAGYSRYRFNGLQKLAHFTKRSHLPESIIPNWGKFKLLKDQMRRSPVFHQLFFDQGIMGQLLKDLEPHLEERYDLIDEALPPLSQQLAYDQSTYLSSLLERQDKLSMAASVEARVPFCNHHLFEYVNAIPEKDKVADGELKSILKKIAAKRLPHQVVYRPKVGLTLPLDQWLRSGKLHGLMDLLTDQKAKQRPFYHARAISKLIDDHMDGKSQNGKYIMGLLTFEIWYRTFFENGMR